MIDRAIERGEDLLFGECKSNKNNSSILSHGSPEFRRHRLRRKRHIAWEQADLASRGLYSRNASIIIQHYPHLTPMELRISALVKAMMPCWKIGEILGIEEVTVERHRCRIRRKLNLQKENLQQHLLALGQK